MRTANVASPGRRVSSGGHDFIGSGGYGSKTGWQDGARHGRRAGHRPRVGRAARARGCARDRDGHPHRRAARRPVRCARARRARRRGDRRARRCDRPRRRAVQLRGLRARGLGARRDRRRMGLRLRSEREVDVPDDPRVPARDARARARLDHQHGVGRLEREGRAEPVRLRRDEGGRDRLDESGRGRFRHARDSLQRDLPRHRRIAVARCAHRRAGARARRADRRGARRVRRAPADGAHRQAAGDRGACRVSRVRRGVVHDGGDPFDRRRLVELTRAARRPRSVAAPRPAHLFELTGRIHETAAIRGEVPRKTRPARCAGAHSRSVRRHRRRRGRRARPRCARAAARDRSGEPAARRRRAAPRRVRGPRRQVRLHRAQLFGSRGRIRHGRAERAGRLRQVDERDLRARRRRRTPARLNEDRLGSGARRRDRHGRARHRRSACACARGRLLHRQRRVRARVPARARRHVGQGQGMRHVRPARALARDGRRSAGPAPAEAVARRRRPPLSAWLDRDDDLSRAVPDQLLEPFHEPAAGRRDLDRHAAGRRAWSKAARLSARGAGDDSRHRRARRAAAAGRAAMTRARLCSGARASGACIVGMDARAAVAARRCARHAPALASARAVRRNIGADK
ncbi:hypothetical protein BURPS1710b_A2376 [Burkholderia pseudomallei 1710b]|uniref:Uncharacterized protein n=3 Tax=Burkholderia pseudomallei TaxID=28450 RepID=Q3JFX8_BURP1|nr:hypothetical protein BURPS1710b_A2376 [Burkholderia pseudomallei 1710b]